MFSSPRWAWASAVALSGALLLSSMPGWQMPLWASENPVTAATVNRGASPDLSPSAVRQRVIVLGAIPAKQPQAETTDQKTVSGKQAAPASAVAANREKAAANAQEKPKAKPSQVASAAKTASTTKSAPASQVSRGETTDKVAALIKNAQSLLGVPYVFGGTTRKGFDCSGFTQYVYQGTSVSLPRTSYAQYQKGTAIKKDQLQPGDLVFFSTYASGPSHVGIYVGGGNFIHAGGNGITTTGLTNSYYAPRYLGARRVL